MRIRKVAEGHTASNLFSSACLHQEIPRCHAGDRAVLEFFRVDHDGVGPYWYFFCCLACLLAWYRKAPNEANRVAASSLAEVLKAQTVVSESLKAQGSVHLGILELNALRICEVPGSVYYVLWCSGTQSLGKKTQRT